MRGAAPKTPSSIKKTLSENHPKVQWIPFRVDDRENEGC
jgi:hypothetical protein